MAQWSTIERIHTELLTLHSRSEIRLVLALCRSTELKQNSTVETGV